MKLLHVDSSPKGDISNSKYLSQFFVDVLKAKDPSIEIDHLDLAENPLPHIDGKFAIAIYKSVYERTSEMNLHLKRSDDLCHQIMTSDAIVFGMPMHNWCYPSVFKAYIDHITRAGLTFEFDDKGNVVGNLNQKKFLFITTRGGDLSDGSPYSSMDALTPALKAAFGFIGAENMTFVDVQPLQFANQEVHRAALDRAKKTLLSIAEKWL